MAEYPARVKRCDTDGSCIFVQCPPLLPDYQAYMRGVDRGDQRRKYYNIGRRSKKWWKRLFGYSIEVSLLNVFVLDASVRPAEHACHGRGNRDLGLRMLMN